MNAQASTIVDPQQAYPPEPVVIDRPTDDLFDFVAACQELRRRSLDERDAQLTQATRQLTDQRTAGRQVSRAALLEAAAWQVFYQRRRLADRELAGLHPPSRLLQEADQHNDTVLYRRREQALALLLCDEAGSYAGLVPQVLADRERACRQQALLVDDQAQLNRQLARLRGLVGLLAQRRVRQLNAELKELDRQLDQVQGELRHQQALLDAIQAADTNRQAWLAEHQDQLAVGAAAVLVLTRRLLALANPPGCPTPVSGVDLDHPMGRDPLAPPATNGNAPLALVPDDSGTSPTAAPVAVGSVEAPGQG